MVMILMIDDDCSDFCDYDYEKDNGLGLRISHCSVACQSFCGD